MYILNTLYIQDPVDPCRNVSGNITLYQISFWAGFSNTIENVDHSECTAKRCGHSFEPLSNPPSSYGRVSVFAENVVGMGNASDCTEQSISKLLIEDTLVTGCWLSLPHCLFLNLLLNLLDTEKKIISVSELCGHSIFLFVHTYIKHCSVQSHRHLKNKSQILSAEFKTTCSVILRVVQFGQHS